MVHMPALPPPLIVIRFADKVKWRNTVYDWYIKINPNGKVPTLCDAAAGVTIWDSCAIVGYLLDQYDKARQFLPGDPLSVSVYQQLSFYLSGTVDNLTATSSPVQLAVEAAGVASGPMFLTQLEVRNCVMKVGSVHTHMQQNKTESLVCVLSLTL